MRDIFLLLMCVTPTLALAHDAPAGWVYPSSCCSNLDCREVSHAAVSERPQGFVMDATGEVTPYKDRRIRSSPDGEYHWCTPAGLNQGKTICLFVPDRGY